MPYIEKHFNTSQERDLEFAILKAAQTSGLIKWSEPGAASGNWTGKSVFYLAYVVSEAEYSKIMLKEAGLRQEQESALG